jgi:hypothetical protein
MAGQALPVPGIPFIAYADYQGDERERPILKFP